LVSLVWLVIFLEKRPRNGPIALSESVKGSATLSGKHKPIHMLTGVFLLCALFLVGFISLLYSGHSLLAIYQLITVHSEHNASVGRA
jgi:hypothetical protein